MSTRKWGSTRVLRIVIAGLLTSLMGAPSARAAGLLVSDGGFGGVLRIDEHSVRVTVNNATGPSQANQPHRLALSARDLAQTRGKRLETTSDLQ